MLSCPYTSHAQGSQIDPAIRSMKMKMNLRARQDAAIRHDGRWNRAAVGGVLLSVLQREKRASGFKSTDSSANNIIKLSTLQVPTATRFRQRGKGWLNRRRASRLCHQILESKGIR